MTNGNSIQQKTHLSAIYRILAWCSLAMYSIIQVAVLFSGNDKSAIFILGALALSAQLLLFGIVLIIIGAGSRIHLALSFAINLTPFLFIITVAILDHYNIVRDYEILGFVI